MGGMKKRKWIGLINLGCTVRCHIMPVETQMRFLLVERKM
jgi:hypothetical protein